MPTERNLLRLIEMPFVIFMLDLRLLRVGLESRRFNEWDLSHARGRSELERRFFDFRLQVPAHEQLVLRVADLIARGDHQLARQRTGAAFHPDLPVVAR